MISGLFYWFSVEEDFYCSSFSTIVYLWTAFQRRLFDPIHLNTSATTRNHKIDRLLPSLSVITEIIFFSPRNISRNASIYFFSMFIFLNTAERYIHWEWGASHEFRLIRANFLSFDRQNWDFRRRIAFRLLGDGKGSTENDYFGGARIFWIWLPTTS